MVFRVVLVICYSATASPRVIMISTYIANLTLESDLGNFQQCMVAFPSAALAAAIAAATAAVAAAPAIE
jgi:hypothetical protein